MAHRFGEQGDRYGYDRDRAWSPERPLDEDQGGQQRFERARSQHRSYGSGSEYLAAGERDPYAYGSGRDERDSRGHGRREYRGDDDYRDRSYRHGSGYGGYGQAPGEAGGSFDSGRSYSAEPGWGPGYGETSGNGRGGYSAPGGRDARESYDAHLHGEVSQRSPDYGSPDYRSRGGDSGGMTSHSPYQPWGQRSAGHSGRAQWRGPKGYQRSDERLKEDISERLMSMGHYVDASEVSIEVKDGNVTLEGTVPERRMKHAIEDVADECMGVKDIDNRIRVSHPRQEAEQAGGIGSGQASMSIGGGSQSSISGMGGQPSGGSSK